MYYFYDFTIKFYKYYMCNSGILYFTFTSISPSNYTLFYLEQMNIAFGKYINNESRIIIVCTIKLFRKTIL